MKINIYIIGKAEKLHELVVCAWLIVVGIIVDSQASTKIEIQ